MRGRWLLAKWGLVLGTGVAFAQTAPFPQPPGPIAPTFPNPPRPTAPTFPNPSGPMPLRPTFPQTQPQSQSPGQLPPLRPTGPAMPAGNNYPSVNAPGSPSSPAMNAPGTPNPMANAPGAPNGIARPLDISLPQPENRVAVNAIDVSVRRVAGAWQLWAGQKLLRDFGNSDKSEANARDAARVYRDLRPTEWAVIGGSRPVVEYGLVNGRPPMTPGMLPPGQDPATLAQAGGFTGGFSNDGPAVSGAGAKSIIPIDMKTVRVEAVRGVWCVRDDSNILFNFGTNKADADQAAAVIMRYGFNRVGVVGAPAVMHYLFASNDAPPQLGPFAQAQLQAQIDSLTRVGIPVGGVGFVGEMVRFDPRKLETRKEGAEWVVAAGPEVFGRYGQSEWAARDALRAMQDSRFTEFCKLGDGVTFFLANGKAPTRIPFNAQGRRFDLNALKVQKMNEKWMVTENNRPLLDCANAEEGETLIRVLRYYQFDQLCHIGPTPKLGVSFFAKGGR